MSEQRELALPLPELPADMPPVPARMVNEYEYCPRLAYLEWVQGEWAESAETVEGRYRHRRADRPGGHLPAPDEFAAEERIHARSVTLTSEKLGLVARLDLVEAEGNVVTPVDYKRGKRPHVPKGAYDPERVQLCVQGLLLVEHGYECTEGVLYFCGSRERVTVAFDDELIERTLAAVHGLRLVAAGGNIPPPLEDSPKCPGCSLVGICLPDEINFLRGAGGPLRPLAVGVTEALPVHVQAHHAKVTKEGDCLEIFINDERATRARLADTSQLILMGNVYVTTPALHELMRRGTPVSWYSFGGWFMGHTVGIGHKNVELRTAQYRASFDDGVCLRLAKGWVKAKIQNSRTFMRRNWRGDEQRLERVQNELKRFAAGVDRTENLQALLGVEGGAAASYFGCFSSLIKSDEEALDFGFNFIHRNRRPPADPVNAMLSFAYALLVRQWLVALTAVGFDAYRGFYHQPRYGRPALALDMMEPFRPLLADSSVLLAINNGEVRATDFVTAGDRVNLAPEGRKRFIGSFERRLSQEVTHPLFGYKISYRRLLELQARLLGRFLIGEIPEYPNFTTR